MELDNTAFAVADVLEETLGSLALRAHNKGLELALKIAPDVPAGIIGDATRLRQIITNLVGNAVKFTESGEVVVDVSLESGTAGTATLLFAVSDTGVGIPRSKQETIFEAFSQADSSMTRKFGGTGLGLAIVTRLVGLFDGHIWVSSKPDVGSTFYVRLEFDVASLPARDANPARIDLSGVPVLVVDDNATNRSILQSMLSRWGMRPTVVASGPAALELLKGEQAGRSRFRLLLVDSQMPEMDGFTFVTRARANDPHGKPAIMMLSSATFHDDVRRCHEAGIENHATKPVREGELKNAIRQLLAGAERAPAASAPGLEIAKLSGAGSISASDASVELRVLLAEDNPVNRRLATALLERRNAKVTIAVDGREALDAWAPGRFDVVLMDIQMPELDGLEVTRLIRAREADDEHLPIIALTARAMSGDREKCLEAGMDGYISKPLRAPELKAELDRIAAIVSARRAAAQASDRAIMPFDRVSLSDNAGNDEGLVRELITLFQDDALTYLARIRAAAAGGDALELQRAAHALKGSSGAICAGRVASAALAVELAARDGNLTSVCALVDALAGRLSELDAALVVEGLGRKLALAS
jgi:CheY-like chemotaxis protein/two-component sensor histidine kinase